MGRKRAWGVSEPRAEASLGRKGGCHCAIGDVGSMGRKGGWGGREPRVEGRLGRKGA